jgi:hypothetical protein
MNKIIFTIAIFSSAFTMAQVAIGKSEVSKIQPANTVTNPSISLEFYDKADNTKGLVLPWVSTVKDEPVAYDATTGAGYQGMQGTVVDGTIILDLSDKKVKYMRNGSWSSLTGAVPLVSNGNTVNSFSAIDSSLQDDKKEGTTAKAAIGTNGATDTTAGILVLTDTDKAMILPKVAEPHLNIKNPAAGMLVYDTTNRQLAVYNGTVWSFWKP